MNRIFSESGSLPSYRRSFSFSKNDGAHLLSSRHDSRKVGEHGDVSLLAAKAAQSIGNLFCDDGPCFRPKKRPFRLAVRNAHGETFNSEPDRTTAPGNTTG